VSSDSSALSAAASTTFHLFPKLPPEIRLIVLRLITNSPKTISISTKYDFSDWSHVDHLTHSAHTIPLVLHTSHESRSITLKHYKLYLSPCFPDKRFFINYDAGTILIWHRKAIDFFYHGQQENQVSYPDDILELWKKVKFLACSGYNRSEDPTDVFSDVPWGWTLARFESVEEVTIGDFVREARDFRDPDVDCSVKREYFKNCKERLEASWKAKDSASRGRFLLSGLRLLRR
jgi:hypothetical protein